MSTLAATLIPRMRELMRRHLRASLDHAFMAMPDSMLELSRQSRTMEDHRLILDTLNHVRLHKRAVAEAFERRLLALYDEKIGWLQGKARAEAPRDFASFDLLDDQVFAQQIALKKLVQKTLEEIDKVELACCEVRLRELFGTAVEGARNPVGPGTALKAAQQASTADLDNEALQASLVNALQPYLAAGLSGFYRELNAMLVQAGLRPDYRPEIQRDTSNRYARPAGEAAMSISQLMNLRELLPGRSATPLDLREMLSALLAGPAVNLQYGARVLADQAGGFYAEAVGTPVAEEVLQSLAAMQHVPVPAESVDGAHALQLAVEHLESVDAHPLDRLTGELVEVVFDFLLHDGALAAGVKQELARLQIVALKAALLDRSFFARREHPMRVLLDEIVRLGSDPVLDTGAESVFLHGLREVVDTLVNEFQADLGLFDAATERLRVLVAQVEEQAERALAETTAALLAEERVAYVREQAAEAVAQRIREDAPAFLREFLNRVWVQAVADARISRLDDALWEERLRLVEGLQDSVRPRLRHELPAYVATLPPLIRAVREGIGVTDASAEEAQAFMDELMAAHQAVLQLRAAPAEPPRIAPQPQMAAAMEPPAAPCVTLQRGDLVEFGDPSRRAKLIWISPARSRFLFSVAGGQALSMRAEEVAGALANGTLRVAERGNFLQQALATLGEPEGARDPFSVS